MEFASFKKYNGTLTVHFFTDNLQIYAVDGHELSIAMWENISKEDKAYFVSQAWEQMNEMKSKYDEIGAVLDFYEKYGW
jgi:hypothetical protein